jgi:hypothetical protein
MTGGAPLSRTPQREPGWLLATPRRNLARCGAKRHVTARAGAYVADLYLVGP